MKKMSIINKWLIGLLLFSLLIPAGFAQAVNYPTNNDKVREKGTLTVHKFEQEPDGEEGVEGDGSANQTVPGDATPLPGVTFEIVQTAEYDPYTDEWTEISDGLTRTGITDDDGRYTFKKLPLGRYTVQEIDGPAHVNLNDEVFFVDIPMTSKDGTSVNYDVHIYPKNETIRGAVELRKIDGATEVPLSGVTFKLFNEDGFISKHTTDDDGYIRVSGLAFGSYYFKEVSTQSGYVLGDQHIPFFIEASGEIFEDGSYEGEVIRLNVYNFVEPEIEKDVDQGAVNRGEEVTFTLTIDLPLDIASYNSFVVYDELDSQLSFVDNSWESSIPDVFSFNQDDQKLTWTVTDFSALEDARSVTISFKTLVNEDATPNEEIHNTATIEYENGHGNDGEKESNSTTVTPTVGNITIFKKDGDDHNIKLAGATFELRDEDNQVVAVGTTDKHGKIYFEDVDYGEYTLVETKAPDGYKLLLQPIEVIVNVDSHDETYKVYNFKSTWHLPRTGGIGTIPFTIFGVLIMGSAIYLYVRRRNQRA